MEPLFIVSLIGVMCILFGAVGHDIYLRTMRNLQPYESEPDEYYEISCDCGCEEDEGAI